jgi:hypothetical protein
LTVLKVIALVADMSEGNSCSGAVPKGKCTSCNTDMKFDVITHKERGRHVADIAHALLIPQTKIHPFQ